MSRSKSYAELCPYCGYTGKETVPTCCRHCWPRQRRALFHAVDRRSKHAQKSGSRKSESGALQVMLNKIKNYFQNLPVCLFGWYRYRVEFTYKSQSGRVVLSYTDTVGVRKPRYINDHRRIKTAQGPLSKHKGIPKSLLRNGTLELEPKCYLGRWRDS